MKTLCAMAAVLGAVAASSAAAESPLRPGWYVAPMATYMKPDSARCNVEADHGYSVALGHRGDFASLELWGQFLELPHGGCEYTVPGEPDPTTGEETRDTVVEPAGAVSLNGAGLGLLVGPFFDDAWLARLYGIVGFGVIRREGHPHYIQSAQDDSTIFGDAGFGYLLPFSLFGWDLGARIEARYRYDVQQPPHPDDHDPAPEHAFEDVIFNVGLQFALTRNAQPALPAAEYEPVRVVEPVTMAAPRRPASLGEAQAGESVVLAGVNFERGQDVLTPESMGVLDGVAEQLTARAQRRVEVGGHTDDSGDAAYNQDLSQRRAASVRTYLIEHGVAADRMTAVGYGEAQPAADNTTREGRIQNRRVELKVLD